MSSYAARNPMRFPIEPSSPAADGCRHFAVIPVYDENDALPTTLGSLHRALKHSPEPVKVVLVFNTPPAAPVEACRANAALLASLRKNDGRNDGGLAVGSDLYFIDLPDKELPDKFRNVGNARKMGFDGCVFGNDGKVTDRGGWLFSLDADAPVSDNYFSAALRSAAAHPEWAGAVFHFEHRFPAEPSAREAGMRYELWLRDYARQCRRAGSQYGFWSIGSAFMVRSRDYQRCGGMRRRAGGEDFYFLQALRKVGRIGVVPEATVYPSGRISARVPFGTGPAIRRQLAGEPLRFYNPSCFEPLREFFTAAAAVPDAALRADALALTPEPLKTFLVQQDFGAVWRRIAANTPHRLHALAEALQIYCDGFFILKFCHWLENTRPESYRRIDGPAGGALETALETARIRDRREYEDEPRPPDA